MMKNSLSIAKIIRTAKEQDSFELAAFVVAPREQKARNGKPYLDLFLVDSSGRVKTKLWDSTAESLKKLTSGAFIRAFVSYSSYQGIPGLVLKSFELETDEQLREEKLPKAPRPLNELENELRDFIAEKITDSDYRKMVDLCFNESRWSRFCKSYAGISFHHSYAGGLLFHTLTMLQAAERLCDVYETIVPIDRSLLYSGIVLHDFGKIFEIEDKLFPEKYTIQGELIGHISLAVLTLSGEAKAAGLQSEKLKFLIHLILASHGRLEFGSPKEPALIEALLLSRIDVLDAELNGIGSEMNKIATGGFTDRIRMFSNKKIFKHSEQKEESSSE